MAKRNGAESCFCLSPGDSGIVGTISIAPFTERTLPRPPCGTISRCVCVVKFYLWNLEKNFSSCSLLDFRDQNPFNQSINQSAIVLWGKTFMGGAVSLWSSFFSLQCWNFGSDKFPCMTQMFKTDGRPASTRLHVHRLVGIEFRPASRGQGPLLVETTSTTVNRNSGENDGSFTRLFTVLEICGPLPFHRTINWVDWMLCWL